MALFPSLRILPSNHGLIRDCILKVLMLNYPCIRGFSICIINYSVSLIVWDVENFCFEPNTAVLERAKAVIEITIDGTGVENGICQGIPF